MESLLYKHSRVLSATDVPINPFPYSSWCSFIMYSMAVCRPQTFSKSI